MKEGTMPVLLTFPVFSAMTTHYLFRNCITFPEVSYLGEPRLRG
jgi:hypothetical protein